MEGSNPGSPQNLEPRPPEQADLVALCRELNRLGANYLVIGGFGIIHAGYPRLTGNIDLLVDTSLENEQRIYKALEIFPDKAVRELQPGEIAKHTVVRVADELVVGLMKAACGIEYAEAAKEIEYREVDGVRIPFASAPPLAHESSHSSREGRARTAVSARLLCRPRGIATGHFLTWAG